MRGLIEKDVRLIAKRKTTMLAFLILSMILGLSNDSRLIVGYLTVFMTVLAVSTIAYDEMENGMIFLFTLPVSVKTYAKEKFLFCGGCGAAAWVLAVIICIVTGMCRGELPDIAVDSVVMGMFLFVAALMLSLMIPIQIKFGSENSRIAMIVIVAVLAVMLSVITVVFGKDSIYQINSFISSIPAVIFAAVCLVLTLAVISASYRISCRILENKEL